MKASLLQSRSVYVGFWLMFLARHRRLAAESSAYWRDNRGRYRGRRGWIIGNGPSLKIPDLSRLEGEVCLAANKIYLAFEETRWRPTLVACTDKLVWAKIRDSFKTHYTEIVALSTQNIAGAGVPVRVLRHLGGHASAAEGFSTDCVRGVFGGRTVTYVSLQIAAHLGLNPIYLIGCDHYYSGESKADPNGVVVRHQGASNHFSPHYRSPGEQVNSAPIDEMNAAFSVADRVARSRGIDIYNATRGGFLETFRRVDFDLVLRG